MNIVSGHESTRISFKTTVSCLDRLSALGNKPNAETNFCVTDGIQKGTVSINQLIEIALERGLQSKLVRLDWQELQAAISAGPMLLLLRNGNVVIALRADGSSADQIVVFDPIYRDAQDFLLPRDVLESAWQGDAIVVKPLPLRAKRRVTSFVSTLGLCAVVAAAGLVLFYPKEAGNESRVFTPTQHVASSEVLSSGAKGSLITQAPTDIRAEAPTPDATAPLAPNSSNPAVLSTAARTTASLATAPGPDPLNTPVVPSSDAPVVVSTPAGAAAASTGEPEPNALKTAAPPNPDAPAVVSTPAGTAAASASEPEPDALKTPAPPNSDTPVVVSTPSGTATASASEPELEALRIPVAPNSDNRPSLVSIPAPATPPSASEPEPDALKTPVAPNSNAAQTPQDEPKLRKLLSSAEITALVARGDKLFSTGDLTSARLFYERAADAGDAPAALRLGESYDPSFLTSIHITSVRGDPTLAARWYRRARELGVSEAETLLNAITVGNGHSLQ